MQHLNRISYKQQIAININYRDLMAAFEIAEANNDSGSIEQLSLIYGNNLALINHLIENLNSDKSKDIEDKFKDIEVRRKLLYTFVNAFSEGELEVYGNNQVDFENKSIAMVSIENYFILLKSIEYNLDNLNSRLSPDGDKEDLSDIFNLEEVFKITFFIYLIKFTLHLKFLLNYNENLQLKKFAKDFIKENGLEGRVDQVIHSMHLYLHFIDYLSETFSHRELQYISDKITAKSQQPHQIAKLCLSLLKNHKYISDLNLYTENALLEFLEFYFSSQLSAGRHHIGSQNHSLIESMIQFSDIYNKKSYLKLNNTEKIENIWVKVEQSLKHYFNQLLPHEISSVNKRVDVLMNYHLYYISSIYQSIGDGESTSFFRLLSYLFSNETENALEIIKSNVFFIDAMQLPHYFDKSIYNKDSVSFLHFYARFKEYAEIQKDNYQLATEITNLSKDRKDYPGAPLFPLLYAIFEEKRSSENPILLPIQYSFKVAPTYLQANLFLQLLSCGKKQDEFISSWGSLEILHTIKNLAPHFDQAMVNHFLKLHALFNDSDSGIPDSYKIDPILDAHWQILNQMPSISLDTHLKNPNSNEKIIRLAQITVELGKNYEAVDGLYKFISFWFENQKLMFNIKGFNKKTFTLLCKRVSDNVRKHYEGLPLFYWKLQHRKIRDEINVYLNSLSIEL